MYLIILEHLILESFMISPFNLFYRNPPPTLPSAVKDCILCQQLQLGYWVTDMRPMFAN